MKDENQVTTPDRREEPRKHVSRTFELSHAAVGKNCYASRDLSLSGAFLLGNFQGVNPGDSVNLAFRLTEGGEMTYQFDASVIRVTDEGIGLKFLSLDMDTYGALLDLTLLG